MKTGILLLGLSFPFFFLHCSSPEAPRRTQSRDPGDDVRRGVVYARQLYSEPLGEVVEVFKSPATALVRRANGQQLSIPAFRDLEASAAKQKNGVFSPALRARLDAAHAQSRIEAVAYFRPSGWRDLARGLVASNESDRRAARRDLRQAVAVSSKAIRLELEELGIVAVRAAESIPALFVAGTAADLQRLAAVEAVTFVAEGSARRTQHHGVPQATACDTVGATDHVALHHIDIGFNDQGYYGEGQKIGILEEPSECEIQDNHEAFAYPVVHQQPSPTGCYSAHAARVASVISPNNTMGNRGAGLAQLFYPNVGVPTGPHPFDQQDDTACSPWGTVSAYHWMVADHDVPTVNESYGCLGGEMCTEQVASGWEGITQDFYSRYYGTTIVKAAGNRDCFGVEDPACPFSLNSICVGSIDSDGDLSCKSSFHNPTHPTSSDREEPDVVAFGGGRDPGCNYVASAPCTAIPASGATAWSKSIGTSFAAPVVTSMVSLFKERCQQHFPFPLDQRVMRAHFRTWALLNVEGPAYSTPRPNVDLTDGAGVVLADLLALSCVPNGTYGNIGLVGGGVDLTQDNGPMPGGEAQYQNGWNPPGETQAMPHSGAKSFGYAPGPGSGRKWAALVQIPLPDGARVRATWSWDGCVPGVTGSAPGAVAIDFDLFLFNNSTNEYYWASQSLDDNNEGFDYTLQGGEGGDISIILAWPDGAQSCEGNTVDAGALSWLALW